MTKEKKKARGMMMMRERKRVKSFSSLQSFTYIGTNFGSTGFSVRTANQLRMNTVFRKGPVKIMDN